MVRLSSGGGGSGPSSGSSVERDFERPTTDPAPDLPDDIDLRNIGGDPAGSSGDGGGGSKSSDRPKPSSPSQTSAQPASGGQTAPSGGGSGSGSSGDNGSESEAETAVSADLRNLGGDPAGRSGGGGDGGSGSGQQQGDGDQQSSGDGSSGDASGPDMGGFGEELGGDPAGGADRDTSGQDSREASQPPGAGPETIEDTGPSPPDAGGFGQELGGDPAGDADRDTGEQDSGSQTTAQPSGGDTDAPRGLDSDPAGDIPGDGGQSEQSSQPEDTIIQAGEETGDAEIQEFREQMAERFGADPDEIQVKKSGVSGGLSALYTPDTKLQAEVADDLEAQLSEIYGEDFDLGEDFEIVESDEGFTTEFTDIGEERAAEISIESQLETRFAGADFEPGDDFVVVERDGEFVAEYTDEGQDRLEAILAFEQAQKAGAISGLIADPSDVDPKAMAEARGAIGGLLADPAGRPGRVQETDRASITRVGAAQEQAYLDAVQAQEKAIAEARGAAGGLMADPVGTDHPFSLRAQLSPESAVAVEQFEDYWFGATTVGEREQQDIETLTGSGGLLTEAEEADLRETTTRRQSAFNFEDEVEGFLRENIPGADVPGIAGAIDVAGGIARVPGDFAAAPTAIIGLGETAIETGQNFPASVRRRMAEEGETAPTATASVGGAVVGAVGGSVRGMRAAYLRDPLSFAGQVITGAVLGTAATRAAIRGSAAARALPDRVRSRGTVDLEDLTDERGLQGELPQFETSPSAPTSRAVAEVRRRAGDQPEVVQRSVGTDRVLLRSEEGRLPTDTTVARGQYELPGLFASPVLSPLRLKSGVPGAGGTGLRLPRPSDFFRKPERTSAFPGDRIEGMPARAQGARRVTDPETGDPIPDPRTAGARFLEADAEPGTAYVRPTGSRTSELEAIYPPGTRFTREGVITVRMGGGRTGTLDIFRRADPADVDALDTLSFEDVLRIQRRRSRRSGRIEDDVVSPFPTTGVTAGPTPTTTTTISPRPTATPTGSIEGATPTRGPLEFDDPSASADIPSRGPIESDRQGIPTRGPSGILGSDLETTTARTTISEPGSISNPVSRGPTTTRGPTSAGGSTSAAPGSGGPTSGGPPSRGPTTTRGPTSGGPTSGGPPSRGPPTTPPPTTGIPPSTPGPPVAPSPWAPGPPGDGGKIPGRRRLDFDLDFDGRLNRRRKRRDDEFEQGEWYFEAPVATAAEISGSVLEREAGIGDFDLESDARPGQALDSADLDNPRGRAPRAKDGLDDFGGLDV